MRYDLLGGLRLALSKGDSLQQAMQSFYNAGYTKEEIEDAARVLNTHPPQPYAPSPLQMQQPSKGFSRAPINRPLAMQQKPRMATQKKIVRRFIKPQPFVQNPNTTYRPMNIQRQFTAQKNIVQPKQILPQKQVVQQVQPPQQKPAQTFIPQGQLQSISEAVQQSIPDPGYVAQPPKQPQYPKQPVSQYGEYKRPGIDMVTVILVLILIVLLGVLGAVFFFKTQLVEFLNNFLE